MIRTANLDKSETVDPDMVDDVLTDAAWAVRSTHHTVLGTAPGSAIFGRDMLFNIPYIADWTKIGQRRQTLLNKDADRHNKKRIDYKKLIKTCQGSIQYSSKNLHQLGQFSCFQNYKKKLY